MRDPAIVAELNRLSTSERLRLWARMGASIVERGPVEGDVDVFSNQLQRRGMAPADSDLNADTYREYVFGMHRAARWAAHGFNVFDLAPDFAASLLLTEPAPLDGQELHLPFPCFFIRLPPGVVPLFAYGEQHWADGIWCHRFTAHHTTHGARTDFFRWSVERKGLVVWRDRLPTNLEDPVDQSVYNLTWDGDPPTVPEDAITTDRALRIIRNLTAWLDATGGLDAQTKPCPPKLKKKASKEKRAAVESGEWPRVWVFGQNVKLRPELRKMATEFALAQSAHAPSGWKVRVKHVVRGHFKFQAHGEGHGLRKRIWVEPYWRGPDGAAAWAHLYEADTHVA